MQSMNLALLQVLPSAVVAMDTEGHIIALNTAAQRLFGTLDEEAVGRLYPDVFGSSLADRMVGLFLRVARSHDPGRAQLLEATLPSGRRATLRANAGPLYDAAGRFTGILFAAEDHTMEASAARESQEYAARAQHLRQALQRYLGDAVAAKVDTRPSFIGLGGVRQVVSVLHADVRGYTTLAEGMDPETVMRLLVNYHGAVVAALQAEGATLDRFIGDAVLALWNAPIPQEGHPRRALRGALALQVSARAVGNDLAYGVGVHTGEAVVGNLGSEHYMNYTAIGDTVNVAARLQSAAASGEVICSAGALAAVGEGVHATPLGALAVKGRKSPVEAYRVEGMDE